MDFRQNLEFCPNWIDPPYRDKIPSSAENLVEDSPYGREEYLACVVNYFKIEYSLKCKSWSGFILTVDFCFSSAAAPDYDALIRKQIFLKVSDYRGVQFLQVWPIKKNKLLSLFSGIFQGISSPF